MTPPPTLGPRRKAGVLAICATSLFLVGLDITALNIALPSIQDDLGTGISGLQWTLGSYTMVLASFLLLSGSLADRFGRRRTFVTGLSLFTTASVACSFAPTVEVLIGARIAQAIGGSMMNPVAMAIITDVFREPRERAQAVGVWGATFGLSVALGPVLGGALVTAAGWRAVFWLNVPIGVAAVLLTLRFVPESKAAIARRFDPVGQALVITLLATSTFAVIEAPDRGLTAPLVLGAAAAAVAALLGLLVVEPRRAEPLLELGFFRSRPFSASIALSVLAFATFGGFLLLVTLHLQQERGLSPLHAGLLTMPMAAMIALVSPVSGRIVGRHGSRVPLRAGVLGLTLGCLMLTQLDATTPTAWLLVAFATFGTGFGFINAPITTAAVSGMPRDQAGVAAAVATTSRQVGQTAGVAITGALVNARLAPGSTALAEASHLAWWVLVVAGSGACALAVVATSAGSTPRRAEKAHPHAVPRATARPQSERPALERGARHDRSRSTAPVVCSANEEQQGGSASRTAGPAADVAHLGVALVHLPPAAAGRDVADSGVAAVDVPPAAAAALRVADA